MRALWLTPELPFAPGGSGGSTRQFHLLRRLVEHGHDVAVAAPVHPDQRDGAERLREAGAALYPVHRPPSRVSEVLAALRARPQLAPALLGEPWLAWQVDVFWTRVRAAAEQAVAECRPEVVLVEHDWAAKWAVGLAPGAPRALTLENLTWRYYEARARAAGGLRGAALALEGRRWRRFDSARFGAYDLLLAMSEDDCRGVAKVSDVRCEVVPNGVDVSGADPPDEPAEAQERPLLLFTGTLTYPPNADALGWLLRELWPRVRAAAPGAELAVVGPNPPAFATELDDPRVTVTGWVDDIRPWYERAAVVLVPLRSGGGTRLKVLDGLAARRAMVATPFGVEGIDVRDREHALLADGTEAFVAAVLEALGNRELRTRLAAAGRQLVEQRYDWRVVGDRLEQVLTELVRAGSRPAPGLAGAAR